MRAQCRKPLPKKLPGAVCRQFRTVDGKRYGPYWYRFWREGGKLRKEYVPKALLHEVRKACFQNRLDRMSAAYADREWREAGNRVRESLKEVREIINAMKDVKL